MTPPGAARVPAPQPFGSVGMEEDEEQPLVLSIETSGPAAAAAQLPSVPASLPGPSAPLPPPPVLKARPVALGAGQKRPAAEEAPEAAVHVTKRSRKATQPPAPAEADAGPAARLLSCPRCPPSDPRSPSLCPPCPSPPFPASSGHVPAKRSNPVAAPAPAAQTDGYEYALDARPARGTAAGSGAGASLGRSPFHLKTPHASLPSPSGGVSAQTAAFLKLQEAYDDLMARYRELQSKKLAEVEGLLAEQSKNVEEHGQAAASLARHWKEEAQRQVGGGGPPTERASRACHSPRRPYSSPFGWLDRPRSPSPPSSSRRRRQGCGRSWRTPG